MAMEDLIGKQLDRYQVQSLLGRGGVGAVFKAYDTVLERNVAIKVLRPVFAEREQFRERFLQEARWAARLDHPNIIKVHDYGEDENHLFIVMEYIPGDNLRTILNRLKEQNRWVVLPEAVGIVQQVSRALQYIHQQGMLHRDIKPENLLFKPEEGDDLPYRVIISDLGLAQIIDQEAARNGVSMGTPAYMSPEQTQGGQIDARSDVYALGILLYELATGRLPFSADSISEAARFHLEETLPPPSDTRPHLPARLVQVIQKATAKDPQDRYANPGELAQALEDVLPPTVEEPPLPESFGETVSLTTQTESVEPGATQPMEVGPFPGGPPQDTIEILMPDNTIRAVAFKGEEMTIGREPGNEIVIDHPKVSRNHSRIQYDGTQYWVSDLNSLNGTYIDHTRLVPGNPMRWTTDNAIRIGDIWLRLRRGMAIAQQPARTSTGTTQVSAASSTANASPGGNQVGIFMENLQISVKPGSSAALAFLILNRSSNPDSFRVTIEGVPAAWIPTPPPTINLPPSGQQEVRVAIHPPQSPQTRPGRYPLDIRVSSIQNPAHTASVRPILSVGVYSRFSSDLRPRRLEGEETIQVSLQNLGNAPESFTIQLIDRFDELQFEPPEARLTLAEGEVSNPEFLVRQKQRPIVGGSRSYPFTVRVLSASSGETAGKTHTGELLASGIIPPVVIPLFLVLCLCLSALAAYGYFDLLSGPQRARETAAAQTQVAAATQAALGFDNEATVQAATETATWLLSDTDGDGVSNFDELSLGLDPLDPDTDNDGLIDSRELEIECLNPLDPDTDDDGLLDGQDPDPCNQFTPTPPPATETLIPTTAPSPQSTATPIVIVITPTSLPPTATETPSPTIEPTQESPTQPAATATPLGGSLLIEFASNRDGNYEIYAMLSDGSRVTRVTDVGGNDLDPQLSPDYTRTVFVSDRDGNLEIYVMNSDGSEQVRLTENDTDDYSPAWSPDGTQITFISTRDGNPEIYVMDAAGNNPVRLTETEAAEDNPAWSPDGNLIAFDLTEGDTTNIYVMQSNGENPAPLTDVEAASADPAWSPEGDRIAFVSNREGAFDLYVMNGDGTNVNRLTTLQTVLVSPSWSRDGLWIAFSTQLQGGGDIYIIRADGTNLSQLTSGGAEDILPSW